MGNRNPDTLGEFSDFTSRGYLSEKVFNKEKGVFRILSLGDSFAVYPPDNNKNLNYNALLQEKCAALPGQKVEIVNAGMPAVGPGYYWHILEKFGDRIKPDLVLVGFFLGNDFMEFELAITIGDLVSEPKDLNNKILGYKNFDGFRLSKLIRNKYAQYREMQRMAREIREKGGKDKGNFSEKSFLEIEKSRCGFFLKDRRIYLERRWREGGRQVMTHMKQWCDARNVPLVLAIFPDQLQSDKELREELFQKYKIPEGSLDLSYPNRLLQSFCRENNIHCLDLLVPFQENARSQQLYALRDTHWNEAGNRLAADLIFQYLQDHKLIKSD
jgi:hypothetical protein